MYKCGGVIVKTWTIHTENILCKLVNQEAFSHSKYVTESHIPGVKLCFYKIKTNSVINSGFFHGRCVKCLEM
jgi:hypothetical protein